MTLDEAVAELEGRFRVGETTATALAVTGEPYVTICCGGIKGENEPHPALCADEATAVRLWRAAVERYARHVAEEAFSAAGVDHAPLTLYWRVKPELERFQMTIAETKGHRLVEDRYAIYSRLLISAAVGSAKADAAPEPKRARRKAKT